MTPLLGRTRWTLGLAQNRSNEPQHEEHAALCSQSAKAAPYALVYAHIKLSRESLPAQLSKTVDP